MIELGMRVQGWLIGRLLKGDFNSINRSNLAIQNLIFGKCLKAEHDQVMASCGGYLQRPFDMLLFLFCGIKGRSRPNG